MPEFNRISSIHNKSSRAGTARFLVAAGSVLLLILAVAPGALAQTTTTIVMRAMPPRTDRGDSFMPLPPLTQADVSQIKIGGKVAPFVSFTPLLNGPHVLQLMVLLDSEQMLGANGQFDDLKTFLQSMPANVEIGLGWLLQGRVKVVQDFSMDRGAVYKQLVAQTREEAASPKNDTGNPYACLRYLASHWPDANPAKLRAVLTFTDGLVRSNSSPAGEDASDTALTLERESVVPYLFYWQDPVPALPPPPGTYMGGQSGLSGVVTHAGGAALYEGMATPRSIAPLLKRLYSILDSESVVTVDAPDKPGKFIVPEIKSTRGDIKIFAPDEVTIGNIPVK